MLIDTHCHLNMIVKKRFDRLLTQKEIHTAYDIIQQAHDAGVKAIVNVGTSLPESQNCVELAQAYPSMYATVGIHPNDCTPFWKNDLKELRKLLNTTKNKIVAIGEIGLDKHYPNYNIQRQKDAFKAQIELALEYGLALVIHSRDAREETLQSLEEFKYDIKHGVIHCFSEDAVFAQQVVDWGFVLGIGGTVTYPKNEHLRSIVRNIPFGTFVLETDAPYLPPQNMRGKQNKPEYVRFIAQYIADLREESLTIVAEQTTKTACKLFNLELL